MAWSWTRSLANDISIQTQIASILPKHLTASAPSPQTGTATLHYYDTWSAFTLDHTGILDSMDCIGTVV